MIKVDPDLTKVRGIFRGILLCVKIILNFKIMWRNLKYFLGKYTQKIDKIPCNDSHEDGIKNLAYLFNFCLIFRV